MPRAAGTRRIDDREWNAHKAAIVRLYERHTLLGDNGVITTMARRGFTATRAQYETRLRNWGIHKYKKAGRTPRSRRETAEPHQEAESVSPDHDNANQTGDIHMAGVEFDMGIPSDENAVAAATTPSGTEVQGIASSHNMQFLRENNSFELDFDYMRLLDFNLPPSGSSVMALAESNPRLLSFNDLSLNMRPPPINGSRLSEEHSFNWSTFLFYDRSIWERSLPAIEVGGMIVKNLNYEPPTTSTARMLTRTNDSNFIYKFANTVAESASFSSVGDIQVLDRFYSVNVFAWEDWSQLSSIPEAIIPEARFDGRLIASIINGFEGLGNIPHAGVLKFLHRHPAAQGELFKYFNTQSSPVVKSFAENVFLACVESDNIDVVRFLINKKLVDVNEAVCHFRGERYTPLQNAAIHQSFRVVKHLIGRMDVNKSFSRARRSNAFDLLVYFVANRQSTLDENFLQSVDDFLKEKATVSMELVQMVLTSFVDERLVDRLLKNLAPHTYYTLLSQEYLLQDIVKNLAERGAIKFFGLVNDSCRDLGGDRYLSQFHQQVDNAFHEAVLRGYNELVGIMLPYASSPRRALQTAMGAENSNATQLILKIYPHLKVDLSSEGGTEDSDTIIYALESKDYNLLRGLETRGVFDRLRGPELGQVLTKALEEANGEYATKILDLDPDFKFYYNSDFVVFDISSALSAALAHDFHDIAWKLFSVGITTKRTSIRDQCPVPMLYVALNAKKPDFVKAIMESGFDYDILKDKKWSILELALELDQDSIFDDLWKARPSPFFPKESLLKIALEKRGEDLFFALIKSERSFCSREGLVVAVECEAESLFDKLISLGARADDDDILEKAIKEYPSMAKPLLDRYWKAYPQGRAGYAHSIIGRALYWYPTPKDCLSVDEVVTLNLLNPNHLLQEYPRQRTLLVKAIATRNCAIVEKFLDAGSDVNSIMADNDVLNERPIMTTALLRAIETEIMEIVQLLLNHGAEVNILARRGIRRTPLQKAAELNNISIIRLLLNYGADVNAIPAMFDGATALQFAAINGNCEMATILIEHWAQQDIPPPRGIYGRWPLEGAAENGRFDMIELLWNAFGSFPEEQCQSAIRRAERDGHIGCKERIQELMARSTAANNRSLLIAS